MNQVTNMWAVSLMRGTALLEQGPLIPGPPGGHWVLISASSDRNLDGMADLLWSDPRANLMTVWLMRGTEPFERGPVIPGPAGDGWICIAARDFNGDGLADVLWHNPGRNLMTVWLMRGTEPCLRGPEIAGPGAGWYAVFGGDLDRDGLADVLWYNQDTNRMAVWRMGGTEVRARGAEIPAPPSSRWLLAAAGDFNRDSHGGHPLVRPERRAVHDHHAARHRDPGAGPHDSRPRPTETGSSATPPTATATACRT